VAAAAPVLARADAADAAGMDLLPVPGDGPEIDADMADEAVLGRLNQHAKIGIGPFDVSPGWFLRGVLAPDRAEQRLCDRPRGVTVQNVDFDAHRSLFRISASWCVRSAI